jgi:hypothetical protein
MPHYNYKLRLEGQTYTIEFYSNRDYEQFWSRYWSKLYMY